MKTAKTSHTPGPWIVDDKNVHCTKGFVNQDPRLMFEDDTVCEVNTDCRAGGLLTEIDKANLRLIASAPSLLAACQDAVRMLGGKLADSLTGDQMAALGLYDLQANIESAIAQATK